MSLPRLTGALRAFSNVTADESSSRLQDTDLVTKKRQHAARKAKEGLTWTKLSQEVHHYSSVHKTEVTNDLRQVVHLAREIVGSDASVDLVESTAVTLFEIFHDAEKVGQKETAKLRAAIGPFPATLVTHVCALIQNIVKHIPSEELERIFAQSGSTHAAEFGTQIHFSFEQKSYQVSDYAIASDAEDEAYQFNFGFDATAYAASSAAAGGAKQAGGGADVQGASLEFDLSWLRRQVKKQFGESGNQQLGLSVEALCSKLVNDLVSEKTNDELQNELFELLGFDCFEMIGQLLANRKDIVAAAKHVEVSHRVAENKRERQAMGRQQAYGSQVTIQSETEKELSKQMRKEEKKLAKREARIGGLSDQGPAGSEFDPQYLRRQRELALVHAAHQPIFTQRTTYTPKESYPFVFDAQAEAQQSSSFIGGTKMSLPVGFDRKNSKLAEEVIIPPSQPAPAHIGKTLVPISQLDEIGQLAFAGMKRLNRIQSVVFETAYHTNENLLICAPTGAGKTNIAMLTILHEIKQHIHQAVIKKDEFKVVYIAPMKALAAEMVRNFGGRLETLGIQVKELTGDMQLTKAEIMRTQMLVTTPEKWDVVTRKSTGDVALTQLVKLIIIDEVHLLHDDRGAVIESLVARTLRQVESSQSMIRIVGLSATLPNYLDVARFLNVNPYRGLFFFDGRFRPVPLGQTFIGVKASNIMQQKNDMNTVCYDKVKDMVRKGHQVMVFVHARNATVQTAMVLREYAKNMGDSGLFVPSQSSDYGLSLKQVTRSRNKQLRELFPDGFSIHHAGMLRQDRTLVERQFAAGHVKVLCCTATLAWGVNLPAHAVVIKGTQIYDANKGAFKDLGILDVMQIFGRAGRPQFDDFGEGTIITSHDKLAHYLSLMTRQNPIESQFTNSLEDNLNAEISLGTVSNVDEGVKWLSYTYFYVRMYINPLCYGLNYKTVEKDPGLEIFRRELIVNAARSLDKAHMIRFVEHSGDLNATDLGRTASHFYIKYDTIETFNEILKPLMTQSEVFSMMSKATEFEQIKVREDELVELERHHHDSCEMEAKGGVENAHGKVNILLQTYISRGYIDSFSLISDSAFVAQNAGRIMRALFEIALRNGWPVMASRLLTLCKTVDKRQWEFENPLKQFPSITEETFRKLRRCHLTLDRIKEMTARDIGQMIHHPKVGDQIKLCSQQLPDIDLEASIQPITRTVLRVRLTITPMFKWNDRVHGTASESWWIWVEDPENNHIYHSEYFLLHKKQVFSREPQSLVFTIPIFEPLPSQYYVKAVSDRWHGSETVVPISFQHLILPERHPPHTELLDLNPLPVTALNYPSYELLYKFTHFNPVQTQIFHTLYHTDHNVLLGAPTGSGKTVAAEIAMFRVFNQLPGTKVVYIAPLKALVRERIDDWKVRFEEKLNKRVVELTGDVMPDIRAIARADVIVTTPEKWDGVSRSWQNRTYVKAVSLLVIDEIHLLGDERGPVLEVIVSRTNFISSHTERRVRVIGLSTALANARDLADWLGIKQVGLFNFRPSVRPVPLEVHISGFPGKHYCPRMATMNKPTFQAIRTHSPNKPCLIFVSSRRQTRLTALDLIAYLAAEMDPKQWLHMEERPMESVISGIRDNNLKLTLAFGIGMHHAGLHERDRKSVEELFVNQKIQVLIATSTLAWGVNFPAHLVIVKGTEFYDGKTKRYKDFPITDVLQMMGRAGRPQFDEEGKAVILVHDIKKHFYKKFLYEPFPVESNLLDVLPEHLNAEIVAGTIGSKQDAMDYITWTYFFRRLVMNPSFYELEGTDHDSINRFLSHLVENALVELQNCYCMELAEDDRTIEPLTLGRISSFYYLHHRTVKMFRETLYNEATLPEILTILSDAHEYEDLPVRHNEDSMNSDLASKLPLEVNPHSYDSPHTKTNLLLQAHFSRETLPCSDYFTDTKSVLDQSIRILQAMIDVSADQGWLVTALRVMQLVQMALQGRWVHDSPILTLPHVEHQHLQLFRPPKKGRSKPAALIQSLPELVDILGGNRHLLNKMITPELTDRQAEDIWNVIQRLPVIELRLSIRGWWADGREEEDRPLPNTFVVGVPKDADYLSVHGDQEYVLYVTLNRIQRQRKPETKAHAPRFPKSKEEGWWMVLGDIENKELLALKRVPYVRGRSVVQLSFYTPETTGRVIYALYMMSDSYIGMDQQYSICLDVQESNIEAQLNSEIILDGTGSDLDAELEAEEQNYGVAQG